MNNTEDTFLQKVFLRGRPNVKTCVEILTVRGYKGNENVARFLKKAHPILLTAFGDHCHQITSPLYQTLFETHRYCIMKISCHILRINSLQKKIHERHNFLTKVANEISEYDQSVTNFLTIFSCNKRNLHIE